TDRRGNPTRPRGQPVPLYRLPEHRTSRSRGRGRDGGWRPRRGSMSARIFGSGIRRREDPRLITGAATYTDDLTLPGMLHAAMLRSPHAHARIKRIDVSPAKTAPGVVAAFTAADLEWLKPMPCAWLVPNANLKVAPYQCLGSDPVRYVGDSVAGVVAETPYQAYDALDLIRVDYEPLPPVLDPHVATTPGAPQLHSDVPNNEAFHWVVAGGDVE